MIISNIDKDYTKTEAVAADAYIVVDSASKGTGKMEVSELSDTVILEYGDDSTYDDVLAMLNEGKRVLVNVDPFYSNNNAIGSDGVQKYPISPYKVLLQANVPTGNPYIDFTGYTGGSVVQVAHVQLWNNSVPSMPSKINNWCVNDVNPTELAKKSELTALASRVDALEENGGGAESSNIFIVNVVEAGGSYVADKTSAEIYKAFMEGKYVECHWRVDYYTLVKMPPTNINDTLAQFDLSTLYLQGINRYYKDYSIIIRGNEVINSTNTESVGE